MSSSQELEQRINALINQRADLVQQIGQVTSDLNEAVQLLQSVHRRDESLYDVEQFLERVGRSHE